jgi:YVTN family beta-propeller protein
VGVVVTPDGTKAYVANVGSNNVSVINTATNIATASVSVGNYPYELQSLQLGQMYLWQTVIAILSL